MADIPDELLTPAEGKKRHDDAVAEQQTAMAKHEETKMAIPFIVKRMLEDNITSLRHEAQRGNTYGSDDRELMVGLADTLQRFIDGKTDERNDLIRYMVDNHYALIPDRFHGLLDEILAGPHK